MRASASWALNVSRRLRAFTAILGHKRTHYRVNGSVKLNGLLGMCGTTSLGRSGLYRHTEMILDLRRRLRPGEQLRVPCSLVKDAAPHFWREEADDLWIWFQQNCGAYELDAMYLAESGEFIVSRARSSGSPLSLDFCETSGKRG